MLLCAESGDLSPLMPLSVRDLIWLRVAQLCAKREKAEAEAELEKARFETAKAMYLMLADLRQILMPTSFYCAVAAFKESPKAMRDIKPIDPATLPSGLEAERLEAERRSKLSPEEQHELRVKDFLAGKKIVPH